MAEVGPKIGVVDFEPDGATYGDDVRKLFRMLQGLVQANVIDVSLSDPPAAPSNGDTYAIADAGATGAWAGRENSIAYWTTADPNVPSGKWDFYTPLDGWIAFNAADSRFYWFSASTPAWEVAFTPGGGGGVPLLNTDGTPVISPFNHIVCGMVRLGYGGTVTVPLSGNAQFGDGSSMMVLVSWFGGAPLAGTTRLWAEATDGGNSITISCDNAAETREVCFLILGGTFIS